MLPLAELNRLTLFHNEVAGRIPAEIRALQASLRNSSPRVTRDALLDAAPALADRHGQLIAAGSAEWYEQARRSQIGGTFQSRVADRPDADVIRYNVRWAAGALFLGTPQLAFDRLSASLERHVLDSGRLTIKDNVDRDRRAPGWQRIARPGGCEFCVMLAQRGAVYKKQTADFASHNNCYCRSAPYWGNSRDVPEVDVRAYEASQRMGSVRRRASDPNASPKDRARAQRRIRLHNARTNEWIESNRSQLDSFREAAAALAA